MGISYSGELDDVNNNSYLSGAVNVTSSAVEAKVGANRLEGRELLTITNKGSKTVYYGPAGVTSTTGDPLYKDQFVSLPFGDNIAVYVVCAGADTATVIVQESS